MNLHLLLLKSVRATTFIKINVLERECVSTTKDLKDGRVLCVDTWYYRPERSR